ncbi:hypothetical protein FS842_007336 [Serendipita sp. 407]|nr:hypothetical protein FS842_007336 [Serendipita sp. 407]
MPIAISHLEVTTTCSSVEPPIVCLAHFSVLVHISPRLLTKFEQRLAAPGATPQTGPNSCSPSSLTWESSVWNLNITTGDITPQWINSDGSSPATYLFRYRDQYMYGSGDLAAFNSYFKANASLIKLRFKKYP